MAAEADKKERFLFGLCDASAKALPSDRTFQEVEFGVGPYSIGLKEARRNWVDGFGMDDGA